MKMAAKDHKNEEGVTIRMRRSRSKTKKLRRRALVRDVIPPSRQSLHNSLLQAAVPITVPSQAQQPTARLLCQNLPQEVTDDVLAVLFQQSVERGFSEFFILLTTCN